MFVEDMGSPQFDVLNAFSYSEQDGYMRNTKKRDHFILLEPVSKIE